MNELIEAIRLAVADGASDDARAAGVSACRTILAALDARAGEPLAAPGAPPIAAAVAAFRGMSPDQLLDLAIARLKAALPSSETPPQGPQFHLIPIQPDTGRGKR